MKDNGLRSFGFHIGQRRQVAATLDTVVEEEATRPTSELDPETVAQMYVQQTLASPGVPEFTAQKARGRLPEFKSLGVENIPLTGTQTVKFRQYYHGIPVYGSLVTVELDKKHQLLALNSAVGVPDVDPVAEVSVKQVAETIRKEAGYPADYPLDVVPRLYYYFAPELDPPRWVLVYVAEDVPKFRPKDQRAGDHDLPKIDDYIVCAHTGKLLAILPRTMTADTLPPQEWRPENVKWQDDLGRERDIWVLRSGNRYRFHDEVLNVHTYDFEYGDIDLQAGKLPGKYVEGSLPPPPWVDGAICAHANATDVAKFLKDVLIRNGLDNMGEKLVSSIKCCSVFNGGEAKAWHNAAWIGTQMVYGQRMVKDEKGNPVFHSFARSLEVVAHEIFHGLTQRTARLEYKGETGALNESYSDIFGILVANYNQSDRTKWDWTIGSAVNERGVPVRDLKAPGKYGQLEKMSDYENEVKNKQVSTGDNGGVHRYSGIHNMAFCNLAMTRPPNDTTKFLLDNKSLAALFYLALTQHLSRTSGFADSRRAVELAARTLFRDDEEDVRGRKLAAIAEAFEKVEIKNEQQPADSA